MALPVLDGNQTATTLSSVVTGGEHIVAHTVVSLGSTAISNITSAVSGSVVSISNFPSTQTIAGTVTANVDALNLLNQGSKTFIGESDSTAKDLGVQIAYVDSGSTKLVQNDQPLPISGTISGTVTANVGNISEIMGSGYGTLFELLYEGSNIPISGTVTANGIAYNESESTPQKAVWIGYSNDGTLEGVKNNAPLPVSGTVTVGNSVTVAGTVTANVDALNLLNQGSKTFIGESDSTAKDLGVQIAYVDSGSTKLVQNDQPLPISGTISGTVTANPQINSRRAVYVDSPGYRKLTGVYVASSNLDNRPDYLATFANHLIVYNEGVDTNRWSIQDSDAGVLIYRSTTTGGLDPANLSWEKSADTATTYSPFPTVQGLGEAVIASLPAISGTVTVGAMPNGSLTTRFGSVTTANTAEATSAVTNASRKYLLIQNVTTSSNVITVGIGFTPTTTQGIQLSAGAGITFESSYIPTGAVYVLSSVTASNFTVLEA